MPDTDTSAVIASPAVVSRRSRAPLAAAALVAVAAIAVGSYLGYQALTRKTAEVPAGGPLVERAARIPAAGPLTNRTGQIEPPPPRPADIIDYLAFLKEIERQRVMLSRKQLGQLLAMSHKLTLFGVEGAIESGEPEKAARQTAVEFQQQMAAWTSEWQTLSKTFLSKPAPQACMQLQNLYYDLLGKTNGAIASVGNSFNQAMSGDPSAALEALTGQRGSGIGTPSRAVADACVAADEELAKVCDRFKLSKDFAIQDDGGGANLLGR